jgi:hypothetical protein
MHNSSIFFEVREIIVRIITVTEESESCIKWNIVLYHKIKYKMLGSCIMLECIPSFVTLQLLQLNHFYVHAEATSANPPGKRDTSYKCTYKTSRPHNTQAKQHG